MQLKKIQHYLEKYKEYLTRPEAEDRLHIWTAQHHFQQHWDIDAPVLAVMYDRSLQNPQTKRLWKRESFEPKDLMLKLIQTEQEYAREMFRDLFREGKSLEGRVGRFVFYCDELLQMYKQANPRSIENNHYHDDYWMVFLYLAFRFPEQYTLYEFESFRNLLEKLGAPNIPRTHDTERFTKVTRTLYKFMEKDADLMSLHEARLQYLSAYIPNSLLIVYDFYQFVQSHS